MTTFAIAVGLGLWTFASAFWLDADTIAQLSCGVLGALIAVFSLIAAAQADRLNEGTLQGPAG
jgi:hypothetical protein